MISLVTKGVRGYIHHWFIFYFSFSLSLVHHSFFFSSLYHNAIKERRKWVRGQIWIVLEELQQFLFFIPFFIMSICTCALIICLGSTCIGDHGSDLPFKLINGWNFDYATWWFCDFSHGCLFVGNFSLISLSLKAYFLHLLFYLRTTVISL